MSNVRVRRGKILVYRVFDIGSEINLETVARLTEQRKDTSRMRLDRNPRVSLVISHPPLTIAMGTCEIPFLDGKVAAELTARVWHFGGLSLSFHINIPEGTPWHELVRMAHWLELDREIDVIARNRANEFRDEIKSAIPVINDWDLHEDYVTWFLQDVDGLGEQGAQTLFERADVPALILAEPKEQLSDQVKKAVLDSTYQYAKDDLAVVDWNSSLVIEPSGSMDVPLVTEFALGQLLEMRYYDDLLDVKLSTLYNSVASKKSGLLSNKYSRTAEEAGQIYLEIAEIVETVENSLKVVGDFYLANVFRAASTRFRFPDWQKSINEKLSNLAEVSKLLHSRVSESRNQMMEMIIIGLIAFEAIPLVRELFFR